MSYNLQSEMLYDNNSLFSSALFLNITDLSGDCRTPKKDTSHETYERLSIESLTPGTTPKGTEKRRNDSNFKYCLSQDLMKRLEQGSPLNSYSKSTYLLEDEKVREDDLDLDSDSNLNLNLNFTPSTFPSDVNSAYISSIKNCESKFEHDEFFKKSKLDFSQIKVKNEKNNCEENDKINHSEKSGLINEYTAAGKSIKNNVNNSNGNFDLNSNILNQGLGKFGSAVGLFSYNLNNLNCKNNSGSQGSQGIQQVYSANIINFDSNLFTSKNNYTQLIQTQMLRERQIFHKNVLPNNLFTSPPNTINLGYCQNVNMYGKNGWVCNNCKNFNYQIRVKCNRCGILKIEIKNGNEPIVVTEKPDNDKKVNTNNTEIETQSCTKSACSTECQSLAASQSQNFSLTQPSLLLNCNSQKKKKPFVERVGDWICFKCKNLNFSFRIACNRCQITKKESEKLYQCFKNPLTISNQIMLSESCVSIPVTETSVNS